MLRVRTDWRNRLANKQLSNNLRVSEEGLCITDYNPNDTVAKWCNEKVKDFYWVKVQKYPEKRCKLSDVNSAVNSTVYMFSYYEQSDDDYDELTKTWTETFKFIYLAYIFCLWL